MRIFSTDRFVLPLPDGHTFPMQKYRLLKECVVDSGLVTPEELVEPPRVSPAELALAHDADYIARMLNGQIPEADMKRIGFPWTPELVERSLRSSGATLEAARAALRDGLSINLAGGTHHAFRDHGEGYCLFNDSVIAARVLQHENRVRRVVVIDLDVHQGNGTAAICRNDPTIFTFSMHGAKNYPTRKEQSDFDIALQDRTGDQEYLDQLEAGLNRALEASRPDMAIYLAGADPHERDRLGRLALTFAGLAERDRLVLEKLAAAGLPCVITMAGGYGQDVHDTVAIHWATVRRAILKVKNLHKADKLA